MGTADWGIWTDPPASKTASARIPFGEWNQMIASGDLGYLVTGLQNTSLGHFHDGADSRAFMLQRTARSTVQYNYPAAFDWSNISGWSANLSAPGSRVARLYLQAMVASTPNPAQGYFRFAINGQALAGQGFYSFGATTGMLRHEDYTAITGAALTATFQMSSLAGDVDTAILDTALFSMQLYPTG